MATVQTNTRNQYYAILSVTEKSVDTAGNLSNMEYTVTLYSGYYTFQDYSIGFRAKIGSFTKEQPNSGNQTSMGSNTNKRIASGTCQIAHDADGTKKALPLSLEVWTDDATYLPVYISGSGTMDLTPIQVGPRPYVYDGSWKPLPPYVWNGSQWVELQDGIGQA